MLHIQLQINNCLQKHSTGWLIVVSHSPLWLTSTFWNSPHQSKRPQTKRLQVSHSNLRAGVLLSGFSFFREENRHHVQLRFHQILWRFSFYTATLLNMPFLYSEQPILLRETHKSIDPGTVRWIRGLTQQQQTLTHLCWLLAPKTA